MSVICITTVIVVPSVAGAMNVSREQLASTYLRYHTLKRDEDFWAFEAMDNLVRVNPSEAWEVTQILVSTASSDEALAYVAAGPLENLLQMKGFNWRSAVSGALSTTIPCLTVGTR